MFLKNKTINIRIHQVPGTFNNGARKSRMYNNSVTSTFTTLSTLRQTTKPVHFTVQTPGFRDSVKHPSISQNSKCHSQLSTLQQISQSWKSADITF